MFENTGAWVLVGVFLFFSALILLSYRLSRKMSDLGHFFLADRKLDGPSVVFSFVATWIGAASTIATLNAVHARGLNGLWELGVPSVLSCLMITFLIARRVAFSNTFSQPEAIEQAYGKVARGFLSVVILFAVVNFVGSQLVAAAQLYQAVLGIDFSATVMGVALAVLGYTWLGGYLAVVMTDRIQVTALAVALVILMFFAFPYHSDWVVNIGSAGEAWKNFEATGPEQWGLALTFVLGWSIAPEMWQRMSSLKQPEKAQKAAAWSTVWVTVHFMIIALIGLASQSMIQGEESRAVLVTLAQQLPSVLSVLVLIGITSAIASSLDSGLNVASLTLTYDVIARFFLRDAPQKTYVWVSRLATALILIPGVAIALYFQDIIQILWISADIYAASMFVPVVAYLYQDDLSRWFGRAIPTASGQWAVVTGLLVSVVTFAGQFDGVTLTAFWPAWPWTTLLGIGLSATVFLLVMFFQPVSTEKTA